MVLTHPSQQSYLFSAFPTTRFIWNTQDVFTDDDFTAGRVGHAELRRLTYCPVGDLACSRNAGHLLPSSHNHQIGLIASEIAVPPPSLVRFKGFIFWHLLERWVEIFRAVARARKDIPFQHIKNFYVLEEFRGFRFSSLAIIRPLSPDLVSDG